jgi:hypothetical protein
MTKGDADVIAAQAAYEAYCAEAGGKSLVSGAALPSWHLVGTAVQYAWVAAARAARACDAVDTDD